MKMRVSLDKDFLGDGLFEGQKDRVSSFPFFPPSPEISRTYAIRDGQFFGRIVFREKIIRRELFVRVFLRGVKLEVNGINLNVSLQVN